jgi:hypothetical protein
VLCVKVSSASFPRRLHQRVFCLCIGAEIGSEKHRGKGKNKQEAEEKEVIIDDRTHVVTQPRMYCSAERGYMRCCFNIHGHSADFECRENATAQHWALSLELVLVLHRLTHQRIQYELRLCCTESEHASVFKPPWRFRSFVRMAAASL